MKKLLLTLGHNASAILVEGQDVLIGYEEERLSNVKADSSFPKLAINKILDFYPDARYEVDEIFVSHWFWQWELTETKYFQPKFLKAKFDNAKVTTVDYYNTHHDLHAKSMWNFCDGDKSGLTIVADGFGNCGECLSLYKDGELHYRSYSIKGSLGLMYQYAIGYLGMKENQDEYKLLGYEVHTTKEFKDNVLEYINAISEEVTNELFSFSKMYKYDFDTMVEKLSEVRKYWYSIFEKVSDKREEIAYFVQSVLESVMMNILDRYNFPETIKCTGGVFYNVKLNNLILENTKHLEVHPLAGDQGCALGFVDVRYDDLFWGPRPIIFSEGKYAEDIIREIETQGYSEVLRNSMEFGPRALGNTTCLALPTKEMVAKINSMNGRDTVMPMAPMVSIDVVEDMFHDTEKVGKSKEFMIISFQYKRIEDKIKGAAHIHPDVHKYTGRIQVVKGGLLKEVLDYFGGILINTSLNAHGQPIIYDKQDYERMKRIQDAQDSSELV